MSTQKQAGTPRGRGPGPGHGPGGPGGMMEKPKNFKESGVKLIKYMKPFKIAIIIVAICAIISTVFTIISPKILGSATDVVVEGFVEQSIYNEVMKNIPEGTTLPEGTTGEMLMAQMPTEALDSVPQDQLETIKTMDFSKKPEINLTKIGQILAVLIIIYFISALFSYIQSFIMSGVSQKITYNLRKALSEKMDRLPLKYYDSKTHGEILSRVTNDIDTVGHSLGQSLTQIITSVATIIGILYMMFSISWILTLVSLVVLPLSAVFIMMTVKFSQKYFKAQQEQLGELNGHVEEMYSGHVVVKAFNGEEKSIKTFQKTNKKLSESAWKSQFFSGMMMPIMSFIGNIGYVVVCIIGGYLAIKKTITVGDIQSFIQYVRQFNQPISQIANIASLLQSTVAAAERVFEFLDEADEVSESDKIVDLETIKGSVSFRNVSFGYTEDKTIINNFSCDIRAGQTVAIVGPTGAGKTTIVKLLMRFYDLKSGDIFIDGVNIKEYSRDDLRRVFSMVLQDTWLFNGSIRENIRYGKLDANDQDVKDASRAAHVHHFIKTLPSGYDMELNEEASNVSGGQKQLLTIARAVLADSPVLILDEATSSVDTRTEILIQKAMGNLMQGRTSFVIAHRLSTIKDADMILVMKDGDIVETGNHNDLIEQQGFYASLYNSQFEGKAI